MRPQSTRSCQQFVRLCDCGCGQPTLIPRSPYPALGVERGQPSHFLHGHNLRRPGAEYEADSATGCWLFLGYLDPGGYGALWDGKRAAKAHRVFYERAHGPIPPGLQIDHLCRNRRCVNPDHLEAVTPAENSQRSANTKLTAAQVAEIRAIFAAGTATKLGLARQFGVRRGQIQFIIAGRSWR